ncbi:hypothetical protein B0H14DRAFT_3458058 [Mycena olivaceomarginata]|nr:hypothetical protein B0H14DRAFT_3458058 [Mycena olivaceomarginata]
MSALGHKEWVSQRKSSLLSRLLFGMFTNLGANTLLTVAGMRNYPDGHTMAILNTPR